MTTYLPADSVTKVKGVGPALFEAFQKRGIFTVKDLLLFIPLRYEDRSVIKKIASLEVNETVTLLGEVVSSSNFYKGRRSIQSATIKDDTGKVKLMWFNNPHVTRMLVKGEQFYVSGKLSDRGVMIQPVVEAMKAETIHTGRLVPIYSMIANVPPATFRRILKEVIDHLAELPDWLTEVTLSKTSNVSLVGLREALAQIHFPVDAEKVISSRERLALEEMLSLIQHSQQLKDDWQKLGTARKIESPSAVWEQFPLPFTLTNAQQRSISEIMGDLQQPVPMNRLLIGDVGSGKTAVAGIACGQVIRHGFSAVLIAPTQILAEQHFATFQKNFPSLPIQLVTGKTKNEAIGSDVPKLYIGTHALFQQLQNIMPALLIYDEQHRFGVQQRSLSQHLTPPPHLLTLSATPIPRTLMLTLFSHLQLSVIDEMPAGRLPIKTWVVPESKRGDNLTWMSDQIAAGLASGTPVQALVVCPFIDTSEAEGLSHVAAATETFQTLEKHFSGSSLRLALLHGRMKKPEQAAITTKLYKKEIDLLVTTPIVEVGVDLPAATIIVIEAAERFGLASLHQLRGRVGRAGQQAYCFLFTSSKSDGTQDRLKKFCHIHNGLELAELDLQRRGAGDLFGTQQHGLDQLQFAEWTNLQLVTLAKQLSDQLADKHISWNSFIEVRKTTEEIPLAN